MLGSRAGLGKWGKLVWRIRLAGAFKENSEQTPRLDRDASR